MFIGLKEFNKLVQEKKEMTKRINELANDIHFIKQEICVHDYIAVTDHLICDLVLVCTKCNASISYDEEELNKSKNRRDEKELEELNEKMKDIKEKIAIIKKNKNEG